MALVDNTACPVFWLRMHTLSEASHALPGAQRRQDFEIMRDRLGLLRDTPVERSSSSNDGPHSQRSFQTASTSTLEVLSTLLTRQEIRLIQLVGR